MSLGIPGSQLSGPALHRGFLTMLACHGLPDPASEHQFAAPARLWAFDYAWLDQKIALEVEGGVWTGGRHTRAKGFLEDMKKYNAAAVLGWRVLRVTPDQLCTEDTSMMLGKVLPRVKQRAAFRPNPNRR